MNIALGPDIDDIRQHWSWFLALGICLVVLGVAALIMELYATLAGVAVFGVLVAAAGIVQIVGAFRVRGTGHVFLYLLVGTLDLIVGLIILSHPLAGALFLTLFVAAMLLFGGVFRIIAALSLRHPHYGWAVLSGVLSCVLGVLLWAQWPFSATWFIGFAIGVNFLFLGAAWIALSTRLRRADTVAVG